MRMSQRRGVVLLYSFPRKRQIEIPTKAPRALMMSRKIKLTITKKDVGMHGTGGECLLPLNGKLEFEPGLSHWLASPTDRKKLIERFGR